MSKSPVPFAPETLETMHAYKTGALLRASARIGAILAGARGEDLVAISEYARQVGLCFQIVDDILDASATTEELGKSAGSDAAQLKGDVRPVWAHHVTASFFAHAGHGQLHVRPFLNLADPAEVRKMQALADDLYPEVLAVGGTISGEHGSGLSRTWYVRKQFGPLYDVFREVKRIFDPQNLLNPGKVVAEGIALYFSDEHTRDTLHDLLDAGVVAEAPEPMKTLLEKVELKVEERPSIERIGQRLAEIEEAFEFLGPSPRAGHLVFERREIGLYGMTVVNEDLDRACAEILAWVDDQGGG